MGLDLTPRHTRDSVSILTKDSLYVTLTSYAALIYQSGVAFWFFDASWMFLTPYDHIRSLSGLLSELVTCPYPFSLRLFTMAEFN